MDEFEKLFVENEVLKDSITGLQQQYRNVSETHEVHRVYHANLNYTVIFSWVYFKRGSSLSF